MPLMIEPALMNATNQEKIDRKLQIEDTKQLLMSLKSKGNFLLSNDLILEFSKKYSLIATERILNYHFDECIDVFIMEKSLINPCVIKESSKILKQFKEKFGDYKNILKILIKRINWSTWKFIELSQLKLVDKEISLYLKSNTIKLIEKKLQNYFESRGICSFSEMKSSYQQFEVPENISISDYNKIFQEQYIIFISNNAFNIIKYSKDVLNDFKENFSIVSNPEVVMKNIINSIKIILLNIGHSTEEILFTLKEIIPIIRTFDSSGFILDSIFKETKTYFKQYRKDLNISLLNFLLKNKSAHFTLKDFETKNNPFSLEYPYDNSLLWEPDPNYIKSLINPEIRTADPINLIISQLSSNSTSSLAESYQKQIANRLLKVETMEEIEKIVEEVEQFRIKCGEAFVSSLDIMINDIIESRNKNTNHDSFKVTIISHRYWPEFVEKEIEYPEFVANHLELVREAYSRQFEDKKIIWRPQMDEVKIALEFQNGIFMFTCPIEAAVLLNSFDFPVDPEEEFDLNKAAASKVISDGNILKSAISFWLKKRILIPSRHPFNFKFSHFYDPNESDCVDSHLTLFTSKDSETFADDEIDLDNDFPSFQQKYWPIISNMLKTFGQISAERIQSTLKMYSKDYKEPQDLLTKFLQSRVKEGILQSTGNRIILYSIVNK